MKFRASGSESRSTAVPSAPAARSGCEQAGPRGVRAMSSLGAAAPRAGWRVNRFAGDGVRRSREEPENAAAQSQEHQEQGPRLGRLDDQLGRNRCAREGARKVVYLTEHNDTSFRNLRYCSSSFCKGNARHLPVK